MQRQVSSMGFFKKLPFQCYSFALLLHKNCIYSQPIRQAKIFHVYHQQINKSQANWLSLKNFLVFMNTKLHSREFYYL